MEMRTESGRPEAAPLGVHFFLSSRPGWPGPLGTRNDRACTVGEQPMGVRGLGVSCSLTLCLPSGSECVTSCLDHNSESIILPVNVTVRDIPHWLNPTRVEVSDRAVPGG